MKTLHRHFPKVCFFAAALAITAIVFGQNSATEVQQGIRGITGTHSGQPPVVDFEKEISSPKSAQRMQKDDRFKHPREPIIDPGPIANGATEDIQPWVVDEVGSSDALPVSHSTLIVVGTVSSAEAHIGYDRTSVYSEFHISVQRTLKGDSNVSLPTSAEIIGTREGGTVAFASGHKRHYLRINHGFPEVGSQYLFFLWRDSRTNTADYGIVTAYLIASNKIYPIDPGKPFSSYEGADAASILNSVATSIQALNEGAN